MAVTAITAQNVIDRFQEIYPDCDDTTGLRLLNKIHKRLLNRLQIRNKSDDVTLTASTREYDLPTGCVKVWAAYYVKSATAGDYVQLLETSPDELDITDDGWRSRTNTSSSTPTRWYITSAVDGDGAKFQIGFLETPPTTTSTYPKVTLHTTNNSELGTDDNIPATILDEEVYISGMAWLWAKREHRAEMDGWKASFEDLVDDCAEHLKGMNARLNTEIYFEFIATSGAVV